MKPLTLAHPLKEGDRLVLHTGSPYSRGSVVTVRRVTPTQVVAGDMGERYRRDGGKIVEKWNDAYVSVATPEEIAALELRLALGCRADSVIRNASHAQLLRIQSAFREEE